MIDAKIRDVSDTALWVAAYRAQESARPDAAFKDPFAALLIGERGEALGKVMPGAKMMQWMMVIRTVVIDRLIMQAINAGADLVLNLGAGLDTRPYRLDLPSSLKWIEVDFENIVAMKNERLKDHAPNCQLQRITLDVTQRQSREQLAAMTASAKSIVVITEGLLPYLDPHVVAELADDLRNMANVQFWIQDFYMTQNIARSRGPWRRALSAAPFKFSVPNWVDFFTQRHWQIVERILLVEEAIRLKRPPPVSRWRMLLFKLLPASVRQRLRDATGYLMIKPQRS